MGGFGRFQNQTSTDGVTAIDRHPTATCRELVMMSESGKTEERAAIGFPDVVGLRHHHERMAAGSPETGASQERRSMNIREAQDIFVKGPHAFELRYCWAD
jgi:hypothetical protein